MNALVLGASSGLGRALASRLAESGYNLVLVARESRDLQATAHDVSIRSGVTAIAVGVDVLDESWIERVRLASRVMGPIDLLVLPLGAVREDDDPTLPFPKTEQLVHVNFIAITQCVQSFWQELEERRGVVIGFGSIAASRGRGRNAAYAAAKRALQSWFESLRHFAVGRGVRVQFYIPGYLRTSLAYGMGLRLPLAEPLAFAEIVVRDVGLDFGVRYYPFYWGYICAVIRYLPWNFFKRLRF